MSHRTSLGSPKWDHSDVGDQPTPSYDPSFSGYPVLPRRPVDTHASQPAPNDDQSRSGYPVPQPSGFTRPLPRMRRHYGYRPHRVFWQLKLILWLVNLFVISYCVYYLLPFPPLAIFGITIHP